MRRELSKHLIRSNDTDETSTIVPTGAVVSFKSVEEPDNLEDIGLLSSTRRAAYVRGFTLDYGRSGCYNPVRSVVKKYKLCQRVRVSRCVSPRERQRVGFHFDFPLVLATFPKPAEAVWADLFALCPSSLITASSARPA
jgi:hypothetical protein